MTTKKTAAKKQAPVLKKVAGKKVSGKKTPSKKSAGRKASTVSRSMPQEGRDPRGGLTAKGREYFRKKEGAHLRPGVQGPADTPEKMVRKGSFLRRHFAHPRGPMQDPKGNPTRLALSAQAWGEPLPKTLADARRLAAKGHELLEQYHSAQEQAGSDVERRAPATKKVAAKKAIAKGTATRKPAGATSAKKSVPGKRTATGAARK